MFCLCVYIVRDVYKKQHFSKQRQAEIGKKLSKSKQYPEAELLTNISKKEIFLYQWDYIINCNENENDNEKTNHISKT